MAEPEHIFSLGPEAAQAAKVATAGGFGAAVLVYLRHPGTLIRAALVIAIGVGTASIFAASLSGYFGMGEVQVAALLGLVGKGIAEGLLRLVDNLDFGKFLPGRK